MGSELGTSVGRDRSKKLARIEKLHCKKYLFYIENEITKEIDGSGYIDKVHPPLRVDLSQ